MTAGFSTQSARTITGQNATPAGVMRDLRGRRPRGEAERPGMGSAIVLGQDLTEVARPVRTVWWQIWQQVTGRWVTVTGNGGDGGLLMASMMPGPPD